MIFLNNKMLGGLIIWALLLYFQLNEIETDLLKWDDLIHKKGIRIIRRGSNKIKYFREVKRYVNLVKIRKERKDKYNSIE